MTTDLSAKILIGVLTAITIALMLLWHNRAHAQESEQRITPPDTRWIVYYSDKEPSHRFEQYDIIVFDRDNHPALDTLNAKGKTLLGYMSVGEAERYRSDYKQVQATHALMEENPNWPGHFTIDVRNPEWTRYLIEHIIPSILRKGFDGIFVDTLDSVEYLEQMNPEEYAGMIEASANMIKAIHHHYPNMKIMINRGFDIMPLIASDVDYFLAEGIMVNYDFDNGDHSLFEDHIYNEYVDKIRALKKQAPHLRIMTLDYWDTQDYDTVKTIYERQSSNGFLPYVTSIELDRIDELQE